MKVGQIRKSKVITKEQLDIAKRKLSQKETEMKLLSKELEELSNSYKSLLRRASSKTVKEHHLDEVIKYM